jgi:hypothetical protein
MKKKELKWTFEVVEIPVTNYPVYACNTSGGNCYFTRPLYDDSADPTSDVGPEENERAG